MSTLIITHTGTPILVLMASALPDRPTEAPPGRLSLDPARGQISLSVPPALYHGQDVVTASGLPPEMVAHLATAVPGAWCVATDRTGLVLAEWPACNEGQPAQSVIDLLPATAADAARRLMDAGRVPGGTSTRTGVSPYALALAEGVYAIAAANSWPPGARAQTMQPPSLAPGTAAAFAALSGVGVRPYPPAGAFYGDVALSLDMNSHTEALMSGRLSTAIASLSAITIDGQPVGAQLAGVLDAGITVMWAAPVPPSPMITPESDAYAEIAAPPPCGWSPSHRTVFLPAGLPSALDAAYLGASLYHAHVGLTGQSAVSRYASAMVTPNQPFPDLDAECSAAAAEAARAWVLLAEVARNTPSAADTAQDATAVLASLPFGAEALRRLPHPAGPAAGSQTPSSSVQGQSAHAATTTYAADLHEAVAAAAATLRPVLTASLTAIHRHAAAIRAAWHDPARRATLPRPAHRPGMAVATGPVVDQDQGALPGAVPVPAQMTAHFVGPSTAAAAGKAPVVDLAVTDRQYITSEVMISLPPDSQLPRVRYVAPTYAPPAGPLLIYRPDSANPGTLIFARTDGVRILLPNVAPPILDALSQAKQTTILCIDTDFAVTHPADNAEVMSYHDA